MRTVKIFWLDKQARQKIESVLEIPEEMNLGEEQERWVKRGYSEYITFSQYLTVHRGAKNKEIGGWCMNYENYF